MQVILSNQCKTGAARTATHSCRTRKRAFHFYSPLQRGMCGHAAHWPTRPRIYAAAAAGAAADAAVYSQFDV